MIKAHIKYFGMLSEVTGTSSETIELPDGSTVMDLRSMLEKKYDSINKITHKVAVNQDLAEEDTPIKDGAEVALLPPFAGG